MSAYNQELFCHRPSDFTGSKKDKNGHRGHGDDLSIKRDCGSYGFGSGFVMFGKV
jgi:hypothetical protein